MTTTALATQRLGAAAARLAGLASDAYPPAAMEALGEQVVLDHLLHPRGPAKALVAVAAAHGGVDAASLDAKDKPRIAQQAAGFLAKALKDELVILDCLYDLSLLKEPSRRELAHRLLAQAGLAPGRLMNNGWRQAVPTPANGWSLLRRLVHGSFWETAAQFFFDADRLEDADIQRMTSRPFDSAALARIRGGLPASLKARFEADYDQFAKAYAATTARLLKTWIPAVAARRGIDLANVHITVRKVQAQQYLKDTRVLSYEGRRDLGEVRQELLGHGYIVCFGAADQGQRLFLSALDGRAHGVPAGVTLAKWVQRNTKLVFGHEMAQADAAAPLLHWRVRCDEVGHGRRGDMAEWLERGLGDDIAQHRERARGQNWDEAAKDLLLNAIPLRATIMALRKGDYLQAGLSASMDAMLVLPLLAEGARAASLAVRAAVPLMRGGPGALGLGAVRASAVSEDIASILAGAVQTGLDGAPGDALEQLRPLDLDRLADGLQQAQPQLAADLGAAAQRARGMSVSGKWRPVAPSAAASAAGPGIGPEIAPGIEPQSGSEIGSRIAPQSGVPRDELTPAPRTAWFTNDAGEKLALLPYGDNADVHTQVSPQGEATGMILMQGADGNAHPALPLATFERYRVDPGRLRNATLVRHDAAEGTVVAANQHYVAIGKDYVEVVRDRSLSSGRTVWRVVAPRGVRSDPVAHRLIHDREAGVWRRPGSEETGLAGGSGAAGRRRPADPVSAPPLNLAPTSTDDFQALLVSSATGRTAAQEVALKALLQRMDATAKGAAILRAMRAHHRFRGALPRIILRGSGEAADTAGQASARPILAAPRRGQDWHLDLQALQQGTARDAVDELAAVYNNMTGILAPDHAFSVATAAVPADPALEASWRDWIATEEGATATLFWEEPSPGLPQPDAAARTQAIAGLRLQIQDIRAHGGIAGAALRQTLLAQTDEDAEQLVASGSTVQFSASSPLASLPPMPAFVRGVDLSNCRIRDWRNLPAGLARLIARNCGLRDLPGNLPRTITYLDVSENGFAKLDLWEGLQVLRMESTFLDRQLVLPSSVQSLEAANCHLEKLVLRISSRLRKLEIPHGALKIIKGVLPQTLEVADFGYNLALRELPDFVLPNLRSLSLAGMELRRVPPMPRGLRQLDLSYNAGALPDGRLRITPHVMALADCEIDVRFSGIAPADLPPPPPGQRPPRFLHLEEEVALAARTPRAIGDVIGGWFDNADPVLEAVRARWALVEQAAAAEREFVDFRIFLDRLAETANAKDAAHGAGFRAEVREWLIEASKPERAALRRTTFAACLDANASRPDGTSWIFAQLPAMRVGSDIARGLYDGRVPETIVAARHAFARETLENFASRHADAIDAARKQVAQAERGAGASFAHSNRLDIYLAYRAKFGARVGLPSTGAYSNSFLESIGITDAGIEAAWPQLQEQLNLQRFQAFLSRDFHPWKELLKRNFGDEYRQAETGMQETMETHIQDRFNAEIHKGRLDPDDPANAEFIGALRIDLARRVQREIEDATYQDITRRFLRAQGLEDMLQAALVAPAAPAPGALVG